MSRKKIEPEAPVEQPAPQPVQQPATKSKPANLWKDALSWLGTVLLIGIMLAVLFQYNPFVSQKAAAEPVSTVSPDIPLPSYAPAGAEFSLVRAVSLDTYVPDGMRHFPIKYTIQEGDSIFGIAKRFNIKPETILWANYDLLNDDPTFLAVGWKLTIPPTDGIYYKWKLGDTLEKVAEKYKANESDILSWPSNRPDITSPTVDQIDYVMIPGGSREIQSWIVPLPFAPRSGATRVIAGPGGCQAPATGPIGSGGFSWPVYSNYLSGFDFTSYHLGIDIAAGDGTPVYASDSGTVIYAGWNSSGYGNMIEIDHNNGYQTLYAHLSQVYVSCGSNVYQGTMIAASGSTGKSTGAHLHFEIRFNGGFVNPWSVLP